MPAARPRRAERHLAPFAFRPAATAVAAALATTAAAPAMAIDYTWFGGNGDWSTAADWSPLGGPPGSGDRAIINGGGVTLSLAASINAFAMSGGALGGAGDLSVAGTASWAGGQIGGQGGNLVVNGTLGISGSSNKTLGANNGQFNVSGIVNNGTATWSGSGNLNNWNSGRFTNAASGSFIIQTDADFLSGAFINQGSFVKSSGATDGSDKTVFSALFNNSGSVDVQQGVLSLTNGGTHSGSFTTGANGWIEFAGGNSGSDPSLHHVLQSGASLRGNVRMINAFTPLDVQAGAVYDTTRTELVSGGQLNLVDASVAAKAGSFGMSGGTLFGAGNLAVASAATWTGGQIGGQGGNLVINGTLDISGSSNKTLGANNGQSNVSGVLNNGTATWSGSGNLNNWSSGRFTNTAGASFIVQTDANFLSGAFINQGSFVKTAGATDGSNKTVFSALFNNSGSVDVQQGVLSLTNGGTHSGNFTTGANGWIEFAGGNSGSDPSLHHVLQSGASLRGNVRMINAFTPLDVQAGAIYDTTRTEIVSGGQLNIADASTTARAGSFGMSGGTLFGAGNLVVAGAASWTGGQIGGQGGNLVVNGTLDISGNSNKTLGANNGQSNVSGVLNNGATTWSGTGNLNNWNSGRFTNAASSSFVIQTDADFLSGAFVNQGSVVKTVGAAGEATVINGTLLNTGSFQVQQGTVRVTTPFDNQGTLEVDAGALFQSTNTSFVNAGTIQGNGTVQTAGATQALVNDDLVSPGLSVGTLTVDGRFTNASAGALKFELASTASFDQLAVTSDVTLGGDLGVWDLGYAPRIGDSFVVMSFGGQRLGGSSFASLSLHGFGSGTAFDVVYHDHDVMLTVTAVPVPEPGSGWLLLAGAGVLGTLERRRGVSAPRRGRG